jgi:ubiquitin
MLVNAGANANPESDKNGHQDNQAKSKAASFQSYSPQSRDECVNGENLEDVASVTLSAKCKGHYKKETNQGDKSNSKFTDLLDDALGCAIWTSRDDSVVSPPDIKDATHGLHNVEYEKGGLSIPIKQVR